MIKPEQIPDDVVEAAAKHSADQEGYDWLFLREDSRNRYLIKARSTLAAALAAWPMAATAHRTKWKDGIDCEVPCALILPLPKEDT